MKVPYQELSIKDKNLRREILNSIEQLLDHGKYLLGPEVAELEAKIASRLEVKHAVGVSSGSDALYLALKAIGVRPGDEVITSSLSWIATYNAIERAGAIPVPVEINIDLNMDVNQIQSAITRKTTAIVPVHFNGLICDVEKIAGIVKNSPINIVEDAAQVFGGKDANGRPAGYHSAVASYSMNSMKPFFSLGEAGAVTTNSDEIFERLKLLRYNGTVNLDDCIEPSINGRIDTIQAAIMLNFFDYLDKWLQRRAEIANIYNAGLREEVIKPRLQSCKQIHCYHSYNIIVPSQRDELREYLLNQGIETKIQHRRLMPDTSYYAHKYGEKKLPRSRELVNKIISLPNHEKMSDEQVYYVIDHLNKFYRINH